jgi:hypothetical protein
VQLRERLKRKAKNVARAFDEITDDGTIVYGTITGDADTCMSLLKKLDVPTDMYSVYGEQIEIA